MSNKYQYQMSNVKSLEIRHWKLDIRNSNRGQIMLLVLVVLATVLISTVLIIGGAQLYFRNATYTIEAEKASALAEAGIDKAIVALNKTGGSYSGETETKLGDGSFSVKVTDKDSSTKLIEAVGYIPIIDKPRVRRAINIEASKGIGVAFVYGVQVGEGGLELGNNNQIEGSIYSNGNIQAGNGNSVTGDVWVAGGPQPNADVQTDCSGGNCDDYKFGRVVNGNSILDIAQSFKPTQTNVLNRIALKLRKIGNPPDATVRILSDSSGSPNKNGVITSGTLYASLVSTSYGWITVTFTSTPSLSEGTKYWIMIDTSADANNYWEWQGDLAQSYNCSPDSCPAQWTSSWSQGNPTWTTINEDLSFQTYMGGAQTSVRAGTIKMTIGGSAHANTMENLTVTGGAYYQTIINSTAGSLHPGSSDPPPKVFPISQANIDDWTRQAGTALSNPVCGTTWGPGKFTGDVAINDTNCILTVRSPIWITGNFDIGNQHTIKLDQAYGTASGVIIVNGIVTLGNGNIIKGTEQGSSLLMVLSTYDSRTNGIAAIDVTNTGNSGVFYSNYGIIQPGNGNTYKELTAWGIRLANSTILNYETGLASTLFSAGPGGSYTLIKGTYQEAK